MTHMQSISKCHSFTTSFVLVTVDTVCVWTDECCKEQNYLYALFITHVNPNECCKAYNLNM